MSLRGILAVGFVIVAGLAAFAVQGVGRSTSGSQETPVARSAESSEKTHAEHRAAFVKAAMASKTSLQDAILAAEAATHGRAVVAEMEMGTDGVLAIDVEVLVGGALKEVVVNPDTGKIVTAAAEDDEDEEEGEDDDDDDGDDGDDDDDDEGDDDEDDEGDDDGDDDE
jgi:phosphopantothenoylcysteine synthetase/decarboxylase